MVRRRRKRSGLRDTGNRRGIRSAAIRRQEKRDLFYEHDEAQRKSLQQKSDSAEQKKKQSDTRAGKKQSPLDSVQDKKRRQNRDSDKGKNGV